MENTTNSPEIDWMVPALIFAKALGIVMEENQGMVVDLSENMLIDGHEDIKKVIVYRKDEQVHIAPCEEDIPEGGVINLGSPESDETTPESSEI
jgi:hypothetical protein